MNTLSLLFLLPQVALADIGWRHGGTRIGPVTEVDCKADGGLSCTRASASTIGRIQCLSATTSEAGCVTPSAQTYAGDKSFTGTVKTPVLDAGAASIGSVDIRGNGVTGTATSSTLTLQSNTADSTTSSTVASMTFQLGADIAATDLGWQWKDSSGNKRLACTEQGDVYFTSHVTDTGAATVAGGNFTSALGAGGPSSGFTQGGTGGAYNFTAGPGGASAGSGEGGTGGDVALTAGAGGAENGTLNGGAGGALTLTGGVGKAGSSGGGNAFFTAGSGSTATASKNASAGGLTSIAGGPGGNAIAATGGNGGGLFLAGGRGGNGVSGTSGNGGATSILGGNAGTSGVTGGAGGTLTLDTGASTGAITAPTLSIGITNAGAITLGRSGKAITANGYGLLSAHGVNVLTSEAGSGAMTAGVLAVTFATAFSVAPFCVCTHVDTTNANACNIKSDAVPTTTGVSFRVTSGGTDVANWICIGQR